MGEVISSALQAGETSLANWVVETRYDPERDSAPRIESVLDDSPGRRMLNLEWLLERGFMERVGSDLVTTVARKVYLDTVKWLADHNLIEEGTRVSVRAVGSKGQLEVGRYLEEHPSFALTYDDCYTFFKAAESGQVDIVQWLLHAFGDDPEIDLFSYNPRVEEGCPTSAVDAAAFNGH